MDDKNSALISVEIKKLSFSYAGQKEQILNDISLNISGGEVLGIVGLSGSGKSTLCYCISGIIPQIYPGDISGKIRLNGKNIKDMELAEIAKMMGIVFQNPDTQLFFPVVEDEIAFGPENLCLKREEIGKRIEKALSVVGMTEELISNPHQLSGGQKQLIALASVLSLQPDILIFDEAMSQIDEQGKRLIKDAVLELKEQGKIVIMVEHDINNLDITDQILVLKQGRLKPFEGEY